MTIRSLNRSTVTQGSRVVLPAYPVLFAAVGGSLLFQSSGRTMFSAFDPAKIIMPIKVWGVIFLLVSVVEVFALLVNRRKPFQISLIVGAGLCGFWGWLLIMAALVDSNVSWTSGTWILFVAVAHIASARSLARDLVKVG